MQPTVLLYSFITWQEKGIQSLWETNAVEFVGVLFQKSAAALFHAFAGIALLRRGAHAQY